MCMDKNSFLSDYTIVDIETTGLSPLRDEIIELSAIKVRNNSITDKFSSLTKPVGLISPFISSLTGITNEMVKDAPELKNALLSFRQFLADDCIVGHNINFDYRFLRHNIEKHLGLLLNNNRLDTIRLARKFCPNLPSYKLANLAKHFNISTEGHHRALKDCEITYCVYYKIKEQTETSEQLSFMVI